MNMVSALKKSPFLVLLVTFLLVSVACSKKEEDKAAVDAELALKKSSTPDSDQDRVFVIARISNGAKLFQEKCAQCHGPEAQGHPDWLRARKEGFPAAPPLNGTGTDIKLSRVQMVEIIRKGASRKGQPVMPSWEGRVNEDDIKDIITWYQALWPAETYQKWRRAHAADESPSATGKAKG